MAHISNQRHVNNNTVCSRRKYFRVINMSSFQKKRNVVTLRGTRVSLQNGQQLVSSGNPALDHILGGGVPIGSILLIEEDKFGRYSDCLAKYYLAEGVIHKHALYVGALDVDPRELVKKLPLPVLETPKASAIPANSSPISSATTDDDMRIAWRYNNLEKIDSVQGGNVGHYFDLSQHIDVNTLNQLKIDYFPGDSKSAIAESTAFHQEAYVNLLQDLAETVNDGAFSTTNDDPAARNVLRIVLKSLASPLWWTDNCANDLCLFLIALKALVRSSLSVCCLTLPSHLFTNFDDNLIHRVRNLVDFSVELESFAGSDKETNPAFKEYHGLIYIRKLFALNTLAAHSPETHDLAFKLRRKRFIIEKLHLPPELQEVQTATGSLDGLNAADGCGAGGGTNKALDF